MKHYLFIAILLCSLQWEAQAQNPLKADSLIIMKPFGKEIEANFLSSYYHQEGDNAAVTGGIGTEKLTDVSNNFIVNIPLDSINAINLYTGADYYTSASTDNIDNNVSSASSSDVRAFATLSYSRLNLFRGESYTFKIGFSAEYDYQSLSTGFSYSKEWNESNTQLSFNAQVFIDQWSLILPIELRGQNLLTKSNRESYNAGIVFSQILTKRLQMSISSEMVYMRGLLSTPFHRVYFEDSEIAGLETLPDNRLKIPVAIRVHYFPIDQLVIRAYYRYYWDDFGILGNTASLETPVKLSQAITLTPFYRYHTQTGSTYFAPFRGHSSADEFYTSDYDLSNLNSHSYGMGFKYYPLYGLMRSKPMGAKKGILMFKYVEMRGSYYERSTGLTAFVTSINLGFGFK